jgi:uncharacterized protein (DUF427 family)
MPGYGILAAHEGTGLLPWSWAAERLERSHNYWLATTRPAGLPHLMAVWGVWMDSALYFSTGGLTRKARNLEHEPRCVVSTESAREAVIVEGVADLPNDPDLLSRLPIAYQEKYAIPYPEDSYVYAVRPSGTVSRPREQRARDRQEGARSRDRDHPHRRRTMKAIWNEAILAESERTVVIEGNHYFPADTLRTEYFVESETRTHCSWKGEASYYHVVVGDRMNRDAAWTYPTPKAEASEITGHVAFWRGVQVVE